MSRIELLSLVAAQLYQEDPRHEDSVNVQIAVKKARALIEEATRVIESEMVPLGYT
jgi:hypothetical protein